MPCPNDTPIPDGFKWCSKSDQCVHPDGPILPFSAFSRDTKSLDGFCHTCKACRAEYQRCWDRANPDKLARYAKEKRARNPERCRENDRKRYRLNIEKRHEEDRCRYWKNPKKAIERTRKYAIANRDKIREHTRRRYAEDPSKKRTFENRRRARKKELPDNFTPSDWIFALAYFHGVCAYCGNPPSYFDRSVILQMDHFIPLSDLEHCPGTVPSNILPACQWCNLSKNGLEPNSWINKKFGKYKAKKKLSEINTYFELVRSEGKL